MCLSKEYFKEKKTKQTKKTNNIPAVPHETPMRPWGRGQPGNGCTAASAAGGCSRARPRGHQCQAELGLAAELPAPPLVQVRALGGAAEAPQQLFGLDDVPRSTAQKDIAAC